MRDLFDEFLEELRRREAQARGEPDPAPKPPADRDPGDRDPDEPEPDDDDADADGAEDEPTTEHRPPPQPIRSRRRPGGPDDGAGMGRSRRVGLWVMVAALIALFVLFTFGIDLWTDALWYASVHFDGVFWTRVGAQVLLFIGGLVLALVVLLGNLALAARLSPPPGTGQAGLRGIIDRVNDAATASAGGRRRPGPSAFGEPRTLVFDADDLPDLTPIAGVGLVIVSAVIALTIGGSLAAAWETILLWAHQVPFSPDGATAVTDPVFGRDIGFFLFQLPFLRLVQGLFNALVIGSIIVVAGRYLVGAARGGLVFSTPVRLHLAVLGGLFLLSVAFGYQLDKYELVYSTRGVATGVSFTDQHAQFFAFDVLTVVSGLAAAFLVGAAFTRYVWPLGLTMAVWFIASLVVGQVYPYAVQRLTVEPNKFAQEQPYIANNIAMTRLAYGLQDWESQPFKGDQPVTQALVDSEQDTFRNARLWDYRPLHDTLDQLQTVRKYYTFTDVDTDRYTINDQQRQVMLSARELALELNPNATGWVNKRIVYTHGMGVAMVPVNEVTNEGQPNVIIGNLPPQSIAGAPPITQPRIYFGERESDYVVVGALQDEFDYPTGQADASAANGTDTRWTGTTGIRLDNTLMRLLFSLRFRDLDLMISDQVTADSQLLFHRSLADRLGRIAPFLKFDKDPYIVVDDAGKLVYVQDAYTTSDRFPNAQAFDPGALPGSGLGSDDFDYIRNSVKITVDAYDGTMHFYVSDPTDPIVRAYEGVFPTLFTPIEQMPADLQRHLRVPEQLFNVQTNMFGRYHVTDPQQFFRTDDLWTVPTSTGNEQTLPSEAYYVVMRMPGEAHAEFLLLQPMVPVNRFNMIAWVAARNDAPNYGTTRVYRFPAESTVFGPAQIEGRIDQDPIISQQISLWNQSGSSVIRGNLIVVPLGDSFIYLQPVYLKSTSVPFPEFQRIVVASARNVVWGPTLSSAVELLLAAESRSGPSPSPEPSPSPGATPTPTPTPGPSGSPGAVEPLPNDVPGLIAYANRHYDLAQAALRAGDFAGYGSETAMVKAALDKLDQLAPSVGLPSPAPSASPAP